MHCLEILGEAASCISQETRERAESTPWVLIHGMRNRLVHAYFDIDLDQVWNTVINDLPVLLEELEVLLQSDDSAAS